MASHATGADNLLINPSGLAGRWSGDRSFSRHRNEGGSDAPGVTHIASRQPACQPTSGQPGPQQMFPLVREQAAEGFPVQLTCGLLGFSTQAFDAWRAQPVIDRDWHDGHLINALVDAHADDPALDYRLLEDELKRVGIRPVNGGCDGCALRNGCSPRLCARVSAARSLGRRCMMIICAEISPLQRRIANGPPTSPNIPPPRARCTAARFKTCLQTALSGMPLEERMASELAVAALRTAIARRRPAQAEIVHTVGARNSALERSRPC